MLVVNNISNKNVVKNSKMVSENKKNLEFPDAFSIEFCLNPKC